MKREIWRSSWANLSANNMQYEWQRVERLSVDELSADGCCLSIGRSDQGEPRRGTSLPRRRA